MTVIDNFVTGSKKNLKKSINKIKLVKKSILDKVFQNTLKYLSCFHLAGLADIVLSNNPKKYFDYNVNGTLNVLECMKANNVKNYLFSIRKHMKTEKFPTSENSKLTQSILMLTKYFESNL